MFPWVSRTVPALPGQVTYTQVAAGGSHSLLLRSDGLAIACGVLCKGHTPPAPCRIPTLDCHLTYTQVAAADGSIVLLRSDGSAVARTCGCDGDEHCDIPALEGGVTYTQVAAGDMHTVLLRSDGSAVACGKNRYGQCDIPELSGELTYTQVSAGAEHTVLLRSDGCAVACGNNRSGACTIPPLTERLTYTHVYAGYWNTVLLRSDGSAVACGRNRSGQCNVPGQNWLRRWTGRTFKFVPNQQPATATRIVLQLAVLTRADRDVLSVVCKDIGGDEVCCVEISVSETVEALRERLASALSGYHVKPSIVTASGQLLGEFAGAAPLAALQC
eukprot:TRINITY_DN5892_c0_g1_i14.p1 TRINITY_DN5892_c0_g1~~TRINITY_DN5892_c0_g1_i14.p1  ORF type:complete len:330 (-),score=6.75 TRINITY_DN5892_c0_g1_i14:18-1007(-)